MKENENVVLDPKELIDSEKAKLNENKKRSNIEYKIDHVATLGPGSSFGEMSLLLSKPRMSSVTCLQQSHLMVLSKRDYLKALKEIDRIHLKIKVDFLKKLPMFSALTQTYLSRFSLCTRDLSICKNRILYTQKDAADKVYIIKCGQFEIYQDFNIPKEEKSNSRKIEEVI